MRPRVKRRTVLLIALAVLAFGCLVRGMAQTKARPTPPDTVLPEREGAAARNPAGDALPGDAPRPRAPRPRFGTPPDQPRHVLLGRDEFARWCRAHMATLGLPEVADDHVLANFGADVKRLEIPQD